MHKIKKKLRQWNVLSTIVASALIPCLVATVIWAVTILPAARIVARNYDEAFVQLIRENASNQWNRYTNTIKSAEYFLQHTSWVRPLYVDLLKGVESSNLDEQNAVAELSLMANHSFGIELFSFNFYEKENYLYTSRGIVKDASAACERDYYSLKNIFVASQNSTGAFSALEHEGNRYLVYSAPFRDIERGRPKGDFNLFFDLSNIEKILLSAIDGKAAGIIYKDICGNTVWEYNTGLFSEATEEIVIQDQTGSHILCLEIPDSVFYEARKRTESFTMIVLAITLLLCIALSVLFANAAYHPLKQVVEKFFGKPVPHENEFQTIDKALEQIHPLAKQRVLCSVLDGTLALTHSYEKQLAYCGIAFPHEYYNVVCIEVPFPPDVQTVARSEQLASSLMGNVEQNFGESDSVSVFLYYKEENLFQIVMNYAAGDVEWNALSLLIENCRSLLKQSFPDCQAFFGVGLPVGQMEDVHRAASQAETAMRVAMTNDIRTPVYYGNLVMKKAYEYDYPLSEVMLMTKAIMSNDIGRARNLLKEVLKRREEDETLNPETLYLLYMDLGLTVTRGARSINVPIQQVEFKKTIRDMDDIEEAIGALLDDIELQVSNRNQLVINPVRKKVIEYIEEHLYDPQLSVTRVAEANGKSEGYVSGFVKEHYGMNWNAYLNKMRIMKAVQLMAENGLDSNSVFPMVGYTNLSTFRRNYIKYTGHTPGQGDFVSEKAESENEDDISTIRFQP